MDETRLKPDEDPVSSPETPEDVAVLYTWANVHDGKYRDFSASRREFRAQQRHRMAESQQQAELEAARSREEVAACELEEMRGVQQLTESSEDVTSRTAAEESSKHAEQEWLAAQRRVETTAELKRAVEQAQIEMEQAWQRAEEQAARYAEAYKRWRESLGHTEETVPERISSESGIAASHYRSRGSDVETGNFSRRATDRKADRQDGDTEEQRSQIVDLRRRRELAMDLSTRTERRPRSPEQFAQTGEHGRADTEERGDDLRRDGRDAENVLDGDISPEWLLRNRPTEDATREQMQANAQEIAKEQRLKEQ